MTPVRQGDAKPTRRDQALRTRLRIMRAAHAAFVSRGYTGARMADIAADAGVAVQTVYFAFHTKPGLLVACYDLAVIGSPDGPPPREQPWHVAMMAATTPAGSVAHLVGGSAAICARIAVLDETVRAAAHEPEAIAVHERGERLRRKDYARIVQHWSDEFGLAAGVSPDECLDLLLTYTGPSIYRQLVLDHAWSDRAYQAWLRRRIQELIAPVAGTS